jgi:glycosyltransferase involved in cell wall biosynthesis
MWIEQIFSRLANRLIAVGEVQRKQIIDVFRFKHQRVERVWNGVSINQSRGDPTFRSRIGAEKRILIGTICTLIEQKGLRDLLAVAGHFRSIKDKVCFVIVGDGPLRFELESMRRKFELEEIVFFTGWVMRAADVALPSFDIFFQPSLWEAMSVVTLEAMAAGKPVVATKVGENNHIVENNINGKLIEPKDIEGMATALLELVGDAGLRKKMGCAAAKKVAQNFTVEHMTCAYEKIYMNSLFTTYN